MARKARLGHKVRRLRRQRGLTQAQMATQLEISASYLNLIEHNRRPVTVPLLLKLAAVFDVDMAELAEDDEARLHDDVMEVFGDGLFEGADLKALDVETLLETSPEVARAVITLYSAYQSARTDRDGLAEQVSQAHGDIGIELIRLPTEEVSDFLQDHSNHFESIEQGAEELLAELEGHEDLGSALVSHLQRLHGIEVQVVSAAREPGLVRRFDKAAGVLYLSEVLAPRSRLFQLANQLALVQYGDVLESYVSRGNLTTPESRSLCRLALASYFAGAVLMPYEAFLEAAKSLRYDVEMLGHRFRTSFEQVCHRLTTLKRPGNLGVPFHFVRVDIAGNISKRYSASGIRFARFSGACPRWNVHAAFMQPGFIRTQLSAMPDGSVFFCIARTIRKEGGGFHSPQSRLAIGLGCEVSYAPELLYSDGVDLGNVAAAVEIGPTCRLCERVDCRQRAFPPLQARLHVDEDYRGVSFYLSSGGMQSPRGPG